MSLKIAIGCYRQQSCQKEEDKGSDNYLKWWSISLQHHAAGDELEGEQLL